MEPITLYTIITAVIPFGTALVKKLFKTEEKKGINALLPIVIGILSSGLVAY